MQEEAPTNIEAVRAEIQDKAVEGDAGGGGGGGFGCDSVVDGGSWPCVGREPRQPAPRADPPLGAMSARQWVLPRCPPFFEPGGDLCYPALGSFFGTAGGLDAGLPLGAGLVKLQRSGRKVECIPQWEFTLGVVYDPRHQASYEEAVEGLTITRPIKPLGRAAPATSSTTASTGAPQGTPPSVAANVRTALGAMRTIGPKPDFEVCAFIIRS